MAYMEDFKSDMLFSPLATTDSEGDGKTYSTCEPDVFFEDYLSASTCNMIDQTDFAPTSDDMMTMKE